MRQILFALLLVSQAFSIHTLFMQGIEAWQWMPVDSDIRGIGMGKTGLAGNLGSNAIFGNPANLAFAQRRLFQSSARFSMGNFSGERNHYSYPDYRTSVSSTLKFSHAAFVAPFKLPREEARLSVGAGYRDFLDFRSQYISAATTGGGLTDVDKTVTNTGGVPMLSTAAAFAWKERLAFGLAYHHTIFAKRTVSFEDIFTDSTSTLSFLNEKSMRFSGWFVTLGTTVRILENLRVGLTLRSGMAWTWDRLKSVSYENTVLMENREDSAAKIDYPGGWGFGIEYQPLKSLVLAAETQSRPFSNFKFMDRGADIFPDDYVLRLGAEVPLNRVALRAGYFTDVVLNMEDPGKHLNRLNGFTLGLGIPFEEIAFDLGYQSAGWNYLEEDSDYRYREHAHRVDAGVSMKF